MERLARSAREAADHAQLRRSVVGAGATSAARPHEGPGARERWERSTAAITELTGGGGAADLELAMLERKAALLREELEQLSGGQDAALSATADEIGRSVAWVDEHLYRDVIASASRESRRADHAGARVCAVC
jgi:hypothetical protein